MFKILLALFILSIITYNVTHWGVSKIRNKESYYIPKRFKYLAIIGMVVIGSILVNFIQIYNVNKKEYSDLVNPKTQTLEEILKDSSNIEIKNKIFSLRKHYYILVDDVLVGDVKGKLFNIFGDVLELRDINNNLMRKETQIKRLGMTHGELFNISLDRLAKIEDSGGITGYIGEERLKDLFSFNHIQYFYDAKYNKLGSAKPNFFMLSKDYKIFDNDKNVDYIIDGKYFSLFNNYSMKVLDSSNIGPIDAIFYTIIEDSIIDSKSSQSSKSGGSSKIFKSKKSRR